MSVRPWLITYKYGVEDAGQNGELELCLRRKNPATKL